MTGIPRGGPIPDPPPPERFDPVAILQALDRHGVRYVVIGGLAAALHGSPAVTFDVDVAPQQGRDNLQRLAAALTEIGALRYTDPDDPLAPPTAEDRQELVGYNSDTPLSSRLLPGHVISGSGDCIEVKLGKTRFADVPHKPQWVRGEVAARR